MNEHPTVEDEGHAQLRNVMEQCDRVKAIHAKLMRKEPLKETDRMCVCRLIRTLVAEWV